MDVRVRLLDAKTHEVDSSDVAFNICAAQAFDEAVKLAGLVLLEPIMNLEFTSPPESLPSIIVDLNAPGHLEAALAWKARTNRPVIGFISHVAVDQIEQARKLGIDRILSNGGFSSSIESILKN